MKCKLYIVIPCYQEQEVLPHTARVLEEKMKKLMQNDKIAQESKIVFVNDGSTDNTWDVICQLHSKSKLFQGINLSRNRGHQNALLAGLMTVMENADADAIISMDADLQDDVNAVDAMVQKYNDGFDVVYGVRSKRDTDTLLKKTTAEGFYKLMSFMGTDIVFNHADYRLMSRRAVEGLAGFREVNLFLRGIVPMIGYKSDIVYYERAERFAGESKYPLKKMLSFAFEGITSLSVEPIRFITKMGMIIMMISIIMILWVMFKYISGSTVTGWASVIISLWAIGGAILFSIGIVGEYIGKIYLETKNRPRYIVEKYLND